MSAEHVESVAQFFLAFSNWSIIIPILLIGLFINNKLFYNLICLILLNIIVNVALKVIFQVPLNPALHKVGYAFPSGHMQLAVVLYGWILLHYQSLMLRIVSLIILVGISFSLIHYGYHDLRDVLGATLTGIILISLYRYYLQGFPLRIFIVSLVLSVFNQIAYHPLPDYALNAWVLLTGIIIGEGLWLIYNKRYRSSR